MIVALDAKRYTKFRLIFPMLEDLEKQLLDQQATLASDIRSQEATLTTLKETYLKVVGALEIIAIQKKQSQENEEVKEEVPIPI